MLLKWDQCCAPCDKKNWGCKAEPCYQRVQRGELNGHVGPRSVGLRHSKGVLLSFAPGHKIRNRQCGKYSAVPPGANTGRKFQQQSTYPTCSLFCGICFACNVTITFCLWYIGQLCAFKFAETIVWKGVLLYIFKRGAISVTPTYWKCVELSIQLKRCTEKWAQACNQ